MDGNPGAGWHLQGVSRLLTKLLTILRPIAMNSELLLSIKSEC